MKWPWSRDKDEVVIAEAHEYSSLDRLDGLTKAPEDERGWHDSHYYERKYGRNAK